MSAASTARERDSSANMRPNTAAPGRVTARSQTDCSPTIDMQGAALTSPPSRCRIRVGHGRAAANAWLADRGDCHAGRFLYLAPEQFPLRWVRHLAGRRAVGRAVDL